MMRGHYLLYDIVGGVAVLGTVGIAWAQNLNWGAAATGLTVFGGLVLGFGLKGWKDIVMTRAAGIIEIEKAKAESNAYRERLEMKVQAEWDELNAHSLKGQLEQLQRTVEEDKSRTEAANRKLHEIRNEFNIATFQHREQREALIVQLGALTNELTAARVEIADLKEHDSRLLKGVKVEQEHQATAIIETKAATVENQAAIERIDAERAAERSGPMPVVPPQSNEPS